MAPPSNDILRFITCGSVDDGKSTLIGRLLHDTELIMDDQLAALARDSVRYGTTGKDTDLALLVDGLEAEREQGITIDVAHRYFTTGKRSFVSIDTPGHEQYTRNMATAASNADVAVILIDARNGVQVQTKRHSFICALLGIRTIVLAINKIDLVDFREADYDRNVSDYLSFAKGLDFEQIVPIPISARFGDNVVTASANTPWYDGPSLLHCLEGIRVSRDATTRPFRFPVQWVNRPNAEFRGYAGTIAAGRISRRRYRCGGGLRPHHAGQQGHHLRRRACAGRSWRRRDADTGRCDRRRPRRPAGSARKPAQRRRPVRGVPDLDGSEAADPRPRLSSQDRHLDGIGDGYDPQIPDRRRHPRAHQRHRAEPERDRRLQPVDVSPHRVRQFRRQPHGPAASS